MNRIRLAASAAFFCALSLTAGSALADDLVGEYNAYIGQDDLYNSNGERLEQPWQIIRQDRANYHKFKIRQRGDENDPFFGSAANRAAAERMVRAGSISRQARKLLLEGDVMVNVKIFEGPEGQYLQINVE